ncbi:hypothetical protein BMR37_24250 [Escherichia coli]|nr:hypothetical protein BMR37_24250 [Escherichia coli]
MVGICVCFAYADARHMDMLHLCWFLTFPAQIRKKAVQDLPLPPHNATSCQHNMWYLIQLLMTLYVVSSP